MYAVSQPFTESLEIVGRAAGSRRYLMATLNNESLELNLDRIERFGLRKYFSVFFSSCFLGMKKPDVQIYRLALALTQRVAGESLFIDDRPLNIECARSCGMQVLRYESPAQMEGELRRLGIAV